MTLAKFLLARIDDAERDANALAKDLGRWHREIGAAKVAAGVHYRACGCQGCITVTGIIDSAQDPARVLAECEAKRRIVEEHADGGESQGYGRFDGHYDYGYHDHACTTCGSHGEYGVPWPCTTLRLLALPYADHESFKEEWKP